MENGLTDQSNSVSVVVTIYNEEKYIRACLESLFNQSEQPDEIIVVDNNSTDKGPAIAKEFPIKFVQEKIQGMIPARNRGFREAKSAIVMKIDADARPRPHWIKRVKETFLDKNVVAVSADVFLYDLYLLGKTPLPSKFVRKVMRSVVGHEILFGSHYAIRKNIWIKLQGELCTDESTVHEDVDLAFHAKKYGKVVFLQERLVDASARRIIHNPSSFFFEYPLRLFKMRGVHKEVS